MSTPLLARRLSWLVLALLLVGTTASDAPAAEHPTLNGFLRTGRYALSRGGRRVAGAEIYHSQRAATFLILHSGYGSPLLLRPRTASVDRVRPQDVIANPNGSRAVSADSEIKNVGRLARKGRSSEIRIKGFTAALVPNPYILGWHGRQALIEHTPEYGRGAERYRPDAAAIKALAKGNEKIQVYVYFGSWCHTCTSLLGGIIRVDQELEGSGVTFRYYGLPKTPAMYKDPEVKKRGIKKLPTGLVYSGNKFLGQITSTAWSRPESILRKTLGR